MTIVHHVVFPSASAPSSSAPSVALEEEEKADRMEIDNGRWPAASSAVSVNSSSSVHSVSSRLILSSST